MSIRFCLKCCVSVWDKNAVHQSKQYYCPKCMKPLKYFGRELAALSTKEALRRYDLVHQEPAITQFTGQFFNVALGQNDTLAMESFEMLRHNPNNIEALFYLAKLHFTKNEAKQSVDYLNKILIIDPMHVTSLKLKSDCLIRLSKFEEAITCLKFLLSLESKKVTTVFNLGVCYYFSENLKQAQMCFQKVIDIATTDDMKERAGAILKQIEK